MKKGFTLIEVLAVVVVLSAVFAIVVPKINQSISARNTEEYNELVDTIENAARIYISDNYLIGTEAVPRYLKIENLVENDYLPYPIKDPRNNESFNLLAIILVEEDEDGVLQYEFSKDNIFPAVETITKTSSTPYEPYLKIGDTLTFTITFNKTIANSPTVKVGGYNATVSGTGSSRTVSFVIPSGYSINGYLTLVISNFEDVNGVIGEPTTYSMNVSPYLAMFNTSEPVASSFTIGSGNPTYTKTRSVTLYMSATNALQMCISTSTTCTSWETYATTKAYELATGDGTKTLYVKFRNSALQEVSSSDSIILDMTAPTCSTSYSLPASYSGGWTNQTVRVTGTCNDMTSGCTTASSYYDYEDNTNTTTAGPGTNGAAWTVTDNAGNSATCPADKTVKVDKTAPTCSVSGGSTSWFNTERTITGTCSDTGGSGCVGNISYTFNPSIGSFVNTTTAGPGASGAAGTVSDNAGNNVTCPANQTVKIDKVVPPATAHTPASRGWANTDISIALSSTDANSGTASYQYCTTTNGTTCTPATVAGNPTLTGDGYYFNGSNYIDVGVPGSVGVNDKMSLFTWIKMDNVPNATRVGNIVGGFPNVLSFNFEGHTTGRIRIYWNNGQVDLFSTNDLRGGWHFVGFVRDKTTNTIKMYIDGQLAASSATAGDNIDMQFPLRIGGDYRSALGIPFKGYIDNIKMYSSALTAAEVQTLYTNELNNFSSRSFEVLPTIILNGSSTTLSKNVLLGTTGQYTVCSRAKDNAGNTGPTTCSAANAYKIDKVLPPATAHTPASRGWANTNISITLSSTDANSGTASYQYCTTTNGTTCTPATAGGTVSLTATGQYTVCSRAKDNAGNTGPTTCSAANAYKIDKVLPPATAHTPASRGWANTDISIALSSTDANSGTASYQYCTTTNGTTCTPATAGGTVSLTATGQYTVCSRAKDNAGNTGPTTCSAANAYKIDKVVPTYTSFAATSTINSITLTITGGADATSGIASYKYYLSGVLKATNTSSSYTYTGLAAATTYTVSFEITDLAGNKVTASTTKATLNNVYTWNKYYANSSVEYNNPGSFQNFSGGVGYGTYPSTHSGYTSDCSFDSTSGFYSNGSKQTISTGMHIYQCYGDSKIHSFIGNYNSGTDTYDYMLESASCSTYVTYSQGSYIGQVTSTNSSAYPINGESGGYWYIRQ